MVINQGDTGAGFLESWHSDSLDFYRLHSSPHPPIYKRKIILLCEVTEHPKFKIILRPKIRQKTIESIQEKIGASDIHGGTIS